ncbi:hypothetical protein FBEOM_9445 [Fusarium beomiforme]|uniref:Uncharacterized protein n=1 Tax=Fusarium beomiforme TaxID=44412 RepID=A0A9P5ADF2_9HYPO|nr:hypothetical protein FBEOM_9445 [Fusarium beomiforme]
MDLPTIPPPTLQGVVEKMDEFSLTMTRARRVLSTLNPNSHATERWKIDTYNQLAGIATNVLLDVHGVDAYPSPDRTDLPVLLAHIRARLMEKELADFFKSTDVLLEEGLRHPPEDLVDSAINSLKSTLIRSFLRWAILKANNTSGEAHSLFTMYYAVDGKWVPAKETAEFVKVQSKGNVQVILIHQKNLPRLIELWNYPVIERDARAIAGLEKARTRKTPDCNLLLVRGYFVLAWKAVGKNRDEWIDANGFVVPGAPEVN